MEHRLIFGCAQFLPFARSRIKAMRATGLRYASQQFEIEGCVIKVRVEGEQEFIRLEGGTTPVISGMTRTCEIIEIINADSTTTKKLHDFKPTRQTWDDVLHRGKLEALAFIDMAQLITKCSKDIEPKYETDSQYRRLCGSMYSGKMAKLVQLISGYNVNQGVKINYDYRWERCHGVVTATDGALWLIEISRVNGIVAVPLPMMRVSKFKGSTIAALTAAADTFGGLPSGKAFPAGDMLRDMLAAGDVIRLATANSLLPFFEKNAYSSDMGWSFKQDGSRADNVCWYLNPVEDNGFDGDGRLKSCHFKIDFMIGDKVPTTVRAPGQPLAAGSAVLSLVEEQWIATPSVNPLDAPGFGCPTPFRYQDTEFAPDYVSWPNVPPDANDGALTDYPVFVCYREDVLDVVRAGLGPSGFIDVYSTSIPRPPTGASYRVVSKGVVAYSGPGTGDGRGYIRKVREAAGEMGYGGVWPEGARDCYVLHDMGQQIIRHQTIAQRDGNEGVSLEDDLASWTYGVDSADMNAPFQISEGEAIAIQVHNNLLGTPSGFAVQQFWTQQSTTLPFTRVAHVDGVHIYPDPTKPNVTSHVYDSWSYRYGSSPPILPDVNSAPYPSWRLTLWRGLSPLGTDLYYPRYYVRTSVLGEVEHLTFSEDLIFAAGDDFGTQKFVGPLTEDEPAASLPWYTPIGYIK